MKTKNHFNLSSSSKNYSRRKFVGSVAATASLLGLTSPLLAGVNQNPKPEKLSSNADDWFKNIKGAHRIVYDAPEPHSGFPFIWSWAYYFSNNQTGVTDQDMTAVVVLRHNAIPFAMEENLWDKYQFGDTFNVKDNNTGKSARRNPYYLPREKDYPMPGIDGIKALQDRGVMFCVCDLALTVYSSGAAQKMNLSPEEVKNEWVNGVFPGIQVVPSGVWALSRAQKNGCGYIYTGG